MPPEPEQGDRQGRRRQLEREHGSESGEDIGLRGWESSPGDSQEQAGGERDRIVVRHAVTPSRTTDTRMVIAVWWRGTSYPADTQVRGFPSRRSSVE